MKKEFKSYKFETSTTMEQLEMNSNSYGAVLKYGNKVIFATMNYKGEILAAIYDGKASGRFDIEGHIELAEIAGQTFEDNGHAVAWAIGRINTAN